MTQGRTNQTSDPAGGEQEQVSLAARTAILTRAADEIGHAVARRLAGGGMCLVVSDPRTAEIDALACDLQSNGSRVIAVAAPDAEETQAERLAEIAISEFGRIDVLVNGLAPEGSDVWSSLPPKALARQIGERTEAALLAARAVIPHMVSAGGGRIVNLVSSVGRYRSSYFRGERDKGSAVLEATVEGATLALTRELAFEHGPHRICVNAVVAGWIRTAQGERAWHALSDGDRAMLIEEISLRRLGEPDEVAAAVAFLSGEAGSYVTGTAIDVNGGWWMS